MLRHVSLLCAAVLLAFQEAPLVDASARGTAQVELMTYFVEKLATQNCAFASKYVHAQMQFMFKDAVKKRPGWMPDGSDTVYWAAWVCQHHRAGDYQPGMRDPNFIGPPPGFNPVLDKEPLAGQLGWETSKHNPNAHKAALMVPAASMPTAGAFGTGTATMVTPMQFSSVPETPEPAQAFANAVPQVLPQAITPPVPTLAQPIEGQSQQFPKATAYESSPTSSYESEPSSGISTNHFGFLFFGVGIGFVAMYGMIAFGAVTSPAPPPLPAPKFKALHV